MIYVYKKDADNSIFNLNQTSGQVEETKEVGIAPAATFELKATDGELSYEQDTSAREVEFIVDNKGYLAVESGIRAIAEKLQYSGKYLNIPFLNVTVKSSEKINWEIGDFIVWDYDGNKYILRDIPNVTKQARAGSYMEAFIYENVKFVSELSIIKNVSFLDIVLSDNNIHFTSLPKFSFYGKASDLIDRLNANISRLYSNWLVKEAELDETSDTYKYLQEYYNVEVDNTNCWNALAFFSSLWGVGYKYYYDATTAKHIIEIGATYNSTGNFSYGQGNGLKIITKNITSEDAIITRMRAYGSDKNLPSRYYNNININGAPLIDAMQYVPNLMIPYTKWGTTDGAPDVLKAYIDCNSPDVDANDTSFEKYGIREASIFFDGSNNRKDIYPTIENVTAGELRTAIAAYTGSETYMSPSAEYADDERLDMIKIGDTISDDGNIDSKNTYIEVISCDASSGTEMAEDLWAESSDETDLRVYKFVLQPMFEKTLVRKGEYEARFALQTFSVTCTDAVMESCVVRIWLVKNGEQSYPAKALSGQRISNGFSFMLENFTFEAENDNDTFAIAISAEVYLSGTEHVMHIEIPWSLSAGELTYYFQQYIINNTFNITLKQVGFDVVKYANTTGQSAKISMKSGDCAGREFVIRKSVLDGDSWVLTCVRQSDESLNQWFPNNNFHISAGDLFVLLDLSMAEVFIGIAENRLYLAACEELAIAKEQQLIYEPVIDNVYLAYNPEVIKEGMMMPIIDEDLGINDSTIINSVTITENDKEIREFSVVLRAVNDTSLGDYVTSVAREENLKSIRNIVNAETTKTQSTESIFNIYVAELARRNSIRQTQLEELLFDADGYFNGGNIRPNSIETLHLSVGSKSADFRLNKTKIEPNYQGDENALYVSSGELIHLQLQIAGLGYTWVISQPLSVTGLIPESAYYLYAKCSKTALTGEWLLSDEQLTVEPIPADGYYYFLVGILFSVLESPAGFFARDYDFTYGMTYVNGRIITTGRIRSIDGNNYFDLDQNRVHFGDANSFLDWNVINAQKLTIKGTLVQSPAGNTFPLPSFRGAYVSETVYYKGDSVTYNGETWLYINDEPSTNTPVEGVYWTKYASKGSGGAAVTLTPTKQVFNYDASGNLVDSGAWFLWATVFNVTGTIYYEWLRNDVQIENDIHSGLSIVPPNNISGMPVKYQVNIRVGSASSPILATDVLTIYGVKPGANGEDGTDGEDGYTIVLSNEAHTIPAAHDGTVLSFSGSGTDIVVFKGVTPIAYGTGANTFDVSATPTNVTPDSTPETIDTYTRRYGDITGMSADSGNISFTIKIRDVNSVETTITKVQSFSKSKAGADGEDGADGSSPALVFRGVYSSSATYYGTPIRVDAVKDSNGAYWRAKTTAPGGSFYGQAPAEGDYWTAFGASFESIATVLLLAEFANIANFIFKNGKLISQKGTINGVESTDYYNANFIPYISLDGNTGDLMAMKATIEGAINAGSIGGFTIANGRIGSLEDEDGLSILSSLIKFYNVIATTNVPSTSYVWAGIGENVLPPSSGLRALGRFENNEQQGSYQQVFDHYDYYYSEEDYMNAGAPTPAEWVYDENDDLLYIQVTIYRNEWVIISNSKNYGIISSVEGADSNIAFEARKGQISALYGGIVAWDTGYSGAAYSDVLEYYIHRYSNFFFSSISSSLLVVRLPAKSFISAKTYGEVQFFLNIVIGNSANAIQLTSVTNGQIVDNNGNNLSYINMYKGDSVLLRYSNGCYYIVSLKQ